MGVGESREPALEFAKVHRTLMDGGMAALTGAKATIAQTNEAFAVRAANSVLRGGDPVVDHLFQHGERHGAGAEDDVVEFLQREFFAERALRFFAQL